MENMAFPDEMSCRSSKKLRLFGFDLQDFNETNIANDDDSSERRTEEKMMSSPNNNNDDQMIIMHGIGKRKCPFCEKEFTNSQALGGHQNAHKKERMIRKRSLLEEKKASLEFYLRSLDSLAPVGGSQELCMVGSGSGSTQSVCYQDGSHGFDLYALQIYVPY